MPFIQRFGSATARGFGLGKGGIVKLPGITENATATDLIQTLLARAGLIAENGSIADALSNNIVNTNAIIETAAIADQTSYNSSLSNIVAESASTVDSLVTVLNAQASVPNVALVLDEVSRISIRTIQVNENIIAAELISSNFATPRVVSEVVTVAGDNFGTQLLMLPTALEAGVGVDEISSTFAIPRVVSEVATVAGDNFGTQLLMRPTALEAAVGVDNINATTVLATIQVNENIIAAELISSTFAIPRVVSEVATVAGDNFEAQRLVLPTALEAGVGVDDINATTVPATIGILMGGFGTTGLDGQRTIQSININAQSNTTSFGSLLTGVYYNAACSSSTRGISAGGDIGTQAGQQIEYLAFSTGGTTQSFGTLLAKMEAFSGASNEVTGLFQGQPSSGAAYLQSIIISTTGSTVYFTGLPDRIEAPVAAASPTRFVLAGGYITTATANILYNDFASGGATPSFGNLTQARRELGAVSSSVRAVFAGGRSSSASGNTSYNTIDYITFATTGNAATFGTLANTLQPYNSGVSSPIRGVWMGGGSISANVAKVMQYITINTTGNALTFGNLSTIRTYGAACSNGHGGL